MINPKQIIANIIGNKKRTMSQDDMNTHDEIIIRSRMTNADGLGTIIKHYGPGDYCWRDAYLIPGDDSSLTTGVSDLNYYNKTSDNYKGRVIYTRK